MHMEVIRVKEEVEAKENKWRAAIKSMENERSDLRFVVSKKDFRMQQLEAEVKSHFAYYTLGHKTQRKAGGCISQKLFALEERRYENEQRRQENSGIA